MITDQWFLPNLQTTDAHFTTLIRAIIMAALCNGAGHYIFARWFLLLSFYLFFLA